MGLFGSISTTITGISSAIQTLIKRPFVTYNQESTFRAIFVGSIVLAKESVYAIGSSITGIYESLKNGVSFLVEYGTRN